MLNRAAVIVRPKQPFLDWATTLDDSDLLPDVEGEQTVYLIPEYEDEAQFAASLGTCYERIFEDQLFGWHTIESDWPKDRSGKPPVS